MTRLGEQCRAEESQLEIVDSWCTVLIPVLSIEMGPKEMKVVGPSLCLGEVAGAVDPEGRQQVPRR